jgi:plasmid stabilization system protein ParE
MMPYDIITTKEAEDETIEAYVWYQEQRLGLGEQFLIAIRTKLELVANNPHLFTNKHKKFREVLIDKPFPYQIVYHIDIKNESIIVSSIFHTSRKPKKKYRKL